MEAEVKPLVIRQNVMPKIQKITLGDHTGYAAFSGSKGYFVYRNSGEIDGKSWLKIRVVEIYKGKNGIGFQWRKLKGNHEKQSMAHQVNIGILPELGSSVANMILLVMQEIGMNAADDQVDDAVIKSKEIDELLGQLGGRV